MNRLFEEVLKESYDGTDLLEELEVYRGDEFSEDDDAYEIKMAYQGDPNFVKSAMFD